jgi:ribosomal protein S18 acetylase RimI-like enzyme
VNIRPCQAADLPEVIRITLEGFTGIAIDEQVEARVGLVNGHDWRWRKARQIEEDFAVNPAGCFVAAEKGTVLGYITTRVDRAAGKGRIPNLAVDAAARGRGIGRRLIEHALDYFRREGLAFAMIETMENNPVGQHLYPSCGFAEVGRQIHFVCKL